MDDDIKKQLNNQIVEELFEFVGQAQAALRLRGQMIKAERLRGMSLEDLYKFLAYRGITLRFLIKGDDNHIYGGGDIDGIF